MTYQPKKVLVTGGAGFIGSNLLNWLVPRYPEICFINVDRLDYCSNLKNLEKIEMKSNYWFYQTDIQNQEFLLHILAEHHIDTVIHLAAQTHVDNSFISSIEFTQDNVLKLHRLLETLRKYGKIQRFMHMSTDEVYGEVDDDHPGCTEKSLLNPSNPYAASKAGAEFLVRSYQTSFGLPVIIMRGNNVFGKYQYPEKVIPKFIHRLGNVDIQTGKCRSKMTIHGDGQSVRNFIHVDDVVRALETILFRGEVGMIYNIGSDQNQNTSVVDIAWMLYEIIITGNREMFREKHLVSGDEEEGNPWPTIGECIEYVADRNFNDRRYAINSENLQKLGWSEEKDFYVGLKETVNWYLRHMDHWENV